MRLRDGAISFSNGSALLITQAGFQFVLQGLFGNFSYPLVLFRHHQNIELFDLNAQNYLIEDF